MAQAQVAALLEGLTYQGMFFLRQAVPILKINTSIRLVSIEHDLASGVDDIAIFYQDPGIDAGGKNCIADYFQVKYHVDRRDTYSSDKICDQKWFGRQVSLLQQFYAAFKKLGDQPGWFRLTLISNWGWESDDPIGPLLREGDEGALPETFYAAGPRTAIGQAREKWRAHLELASDEFEDFARRLRFCTDYLSRRTLREALGDRLASLGLKQIPEDRIHNPYDSLVQQLVMNRTTEFNAQAFRAMCERERLFEAPIRVGPPVLGIRSFLRAAERMEDECDQYVCVSKYFSGRHIRNPTLWHENITIEVMSFLSNCALREIEHHLKLDCHTSIAFLAGFELDRKSGAKVFPIQKGIGSNVWKPNGVAPTDPNESQWVVEIEDCAQEVHDVALAVSVSRDTSVDVRKFLNKQVPVSRLCTAKPANGIGASSISGPDHALRLADKLAELIRANRPTNGGTLHLFISAPNAFAFLLGQHRNALGRIQLYEFDFEETQGGTYTPSILFPILPEA